VNVSYMYITNRDHRSNVYAIVLYCNGVCIDRPGLHTIFSTVNPSDGFKIKDCKDVWGVIKKNLQFRRIRQ